MQIELTGNMAAHLQSTSAWAPQVSNKTRYYFRNVFMKEMSVMPLNITPSRLWM